MLIFLAGFGTQLLINHHHPFLVQYFGKGFIHDGTESPVTPPQYIDPYDLLAEDRIYKTAPPLN